MTAPARVKCARTRDLLDRATAQGFEIVWTRNGHIEVRRGGRRVATTGSTPSDSRAYLNFRASLRRAGYQGA